MSHPIRSKGPVVSVGRFSSGLASAKLDEFLYHRQMKKDWDRLTFPELYVAAIRLYDLGYRKKRFAGFIPLVSGQAIGCSPGSGRDGKYG